MNRKALMLLVSILCVALATAEEKRTTIVCEGTTITYRSGRYCERCHFTSCCIFRENQEDECWHNLDWCEDCSREI